MNSCDMFGLTVCTQSLNTHPSIDTTEDSLILQMLAFWLTNKQFFLVHNLKSRNVRKF